MTIQENIQIKKLERKINKLEKELEHYRNRFDKSHEFERAFRIFHNRFSKREYDSHWPIQRVQEALLNLKEKLP